MIDGPFHEEPHRLDTTNITTSFARSNILLASTVLSAAASKPLSDLDEGLCKEYSLFDMLHLHAKAIDGLEHRYNPFVDDCRVNLFHSTMIEHHACT